MKAYVLLCLCCCRLLSFAQAPVDLSDYDKNGAARVIRQGDLLTLQWPAGKRSGIEEKARLVLDLGKGKPLFRSIEMSSRGKWKEIAAGLDPAFILTIGKRTLDPSSGGWDVFFDKVPTRPYRSYTVDLVKQNASVTTTGTRTVLRIGRLTSASFGGALEITLYNGSPLFDVAAVLATQMDSTAILYDAGLVCKARTWKRIAWSGTDDHLQTAAPDTAAKSSNLAVKYRTVIGGNDGGSLALFPAPHQYFYPLDEAFNLKFTWYGSHYRELIPGFGIGIRQDLQGDHRYVPWFNAPPGTQQRLHFFCLLSTGDPAPALEAVKQFTHDDAFEALPGYKTMQSHFHNEFTSSVVLAGKPIPEEPNFVKVFRRMGVNIVHLAEFHGPGHPKGPDEIRLKELRALFGQCQRLSKDSFLLLPGEEANNFYGGHWLAFFPRPVYWIMSRNADTPFMVNDPQLGKVYHVGNREEMLKLLEIENGLSWTAHARTKASVGFPDAYKGEEFFLSDHFFGAAWKAIPADLSLPTLSKRVLNLMDDMNNWGLKKHIIGEEDVFTIEPENEMYGHMNVNYLQMDTLPAYDNGWQPVLDVMKNGKFFTTTGEVLLPSFTVNGKGAGETTQAGPDGKATILLSARWTFPLGFAEIISGDGRQVYRERIDLRNTQAFGEQLFTFHPDLRNRKWVRVEVWDAAANGAFTQTVWIN